jgi:hypothetical protein
LFSSAGLLFKALLTAIAIPPFDYFIQMAATRGIGMKPGFKRA